MAVEGINHAIIGGVVCDEPRYRTFDSGGRLLSLRVRCEDRSLDRDGNEQVFTSYHTLSCWGSEAERLGTTPLKGCYVVGRGKVVIRSYKTDEGKKQSMEINCNKMSVLARDVEEVAGSNMAPATDHDDMPF